MGWLYCDPAYGGSACDFVPESRNWRSDPYDNQLGEAEYDDERVAANMTEHRLTDLGIYSICRKDGKDEADGSDRRYK